MTQRRPAFFLAAALAAGCLPALVPAAHAADWEFSGNAGLYSDYRFRGISQTNKKPAFQGGFDLAHSSGFYVGNWNSNVDSGFYGGSNLEMDFYGGFQGEASGFSYEVGVLYYYYPGSDPKIDNTELYISGGWGPLSLKYSYAVSDFFAVPDSDGAWYLDGKIEYPMSEQLTIFARVGHQRLGNNAAVTEIDGSGPHDSMTDWSIGVGYTVAGWDLGAAYVGSNRKLEGSVAGRDISGDTVVLSIGKSF